MRAHLPAVAILHFVLTPAVALADPCIPCSGLLENADACDPPSPSLLCEGPSADAWAGVDACMCSAPGACADVCGAFCPGGSLSVELYVCPGDTPNTAACMTCVGDTENGCGIEAQTCAFDG